MSTRNRFTQAQCGVDSRFHPQTSSAFFMIRTEERGRNAILRFDVSPEIGFGHFRRALTLSGFLDRYRFAVLPDAIDQLKQAGVPPANIISVEPTTGSWLAEGREFGHVIFDICYDGNRARAEAEILKACDAISSITVVDSMPPDHFCPTVSTGQRYPDLVVTPYLDAEKLREPPPALRWKTGPEFAILDSSYARAAQDAIKFPLGLRILVTCGGSDPTELSLVCLNALGHFSGNIDLVVGPLFSEDLVAKLQIAASKTRNLQLHFRPATLAPLLCNTSLVVGRPGLIRYEAAALGRNSVFLSETESYKDYYKNFQSAGLAEMYFSTETGGIDSFVHRLSHLHPQDPLFNPNLHGRTVVRCDGAKHFLDLVFGQNHKK